MQANPVWNASRKAIKSRARRVFPAAVAAAATSRKRARSPGTAGRAAAAAAAAMHDSGESPTDDEEDCHSEQSDEAATGQAGDHSTDSDEEAGSSVSYDQEQDASEDALDTSDEMEDVSPPEQHSEEPLDAEDSSSSGGSSRDQRASRPVALTERPGSAAGDDISQPEASVLHLARMPEYGPTVLCSVIHAWLAIEAISSCHISNTALEKHWWR